MPTARLRPIDPMFEGYEAKALTSDLLYMERQVDELRDALLRRDPRENLIKRLVSQWRRPRQNKPHVKIKQP